ncbi:ATP-binding protein [Dokdonella sp.]|uniref:sensor histidine kinase n=1 Tax=Dokdonella sp. TaxID=2291710 RepID=UPI002632D31A|nr:ATP-binding protein [Dokdonella sp.]
MVPRPGFASWLWRAPVDDPVDRRNAPMLQVVLLLLGLAPPLMWGYRALFSGIPWRAGEATSMVSSLAVSVVALAGVLLIRRGRFQWAIRQMLALIALAMILGYAFGGSASQRYEQPLVVVWMVLAGLMVGRRALWVMYGCVLAAFVAGGFADLRAGNPIDTPPNVAVSIAISGLIFLLIAIVVDRSVRALRESLADATRRGDALAQANRRLEAEMVERERMQQQLVHAQKVEAVGLLAAGVAHDFNHLLGLILGYAAKGCGLDDVDGLKKALAGVEAAGRRATAVTQRLLTFARRGETRVERFDLGEALRDLQPMLRQLFAPDVRITCELPEALLAVDFDRGQFDLVVLAVAGNANDAMPDGGWFAIELRPAEDGSSAELSLRDSGQGMGKEARDRLFEPFFTTKPVGRGTGLGLSVASDLVRAAGGRIEVESELGEGTTIRVVLPLAEAEYAHA